EPTMQRRTVLAIVASAALAAGMIVAQDPSPEATTIPPRPPVVRPPVPRPTTTIPLPLPLPTAISTATPLPAPSPAITAPPISTRPNIVLIVADDLDRSAFE